MATRLEIAELYVATFNRAADADGLAYWISDGTSATTTLTSLEDLSAAMIDNAEYTTLYPAGTTNEDFVIALYNNVLGRTVDGTDAGVAYWVADLAAGNVTTAKMVTAIINGAKATTGDATDKATIENKATVGLAYADADLNDTAEATTIMSGVTSNTATVTTAQTTIDAAVVAAANESTGIAGTTQSLTTSFDALTATDNDDTFVGVLSGALATGSTAQPGDSVNGGKGADAYSLYVSGNAGGFTFSGFTTNDVETVGVSNFSSAASLTVDTSTMFGVSKLGTIGSGVTGDTIFSNIASVTNAMASGAGDLTLTYTTAAAEGTTDIQNVEVNAMTGAVILTEVETVSLTTTGSKSTITTLNTDGGTQDATTLNIAGDQALTITTDLNTNNAALKTIDASTATGKIKLTTSDTGTNNVTLGTANDTLVRNVQNNDTATTDSFDGGEGTDTLSVTTGANISSANLARYSSFETLAITGGNGQTIDLSGVSMFTTLVNSDDTTGTTAVNNIAADTALSVTVAGGTDENTTLTLANNTATDSINVTVGSALAGGTAVTMGTLTLNNHETINIESKNSANNSIAAVTSSNATNLVATGDKQLTLTAFTSSSLLKTIDASAMTGKFIMGATSAATAITVTGGTADDTIIGGSGNDTLSGGAGNDAITSAGGNDTINGEAGNDTINMIFANLNSSDSIDGGEGTDALNFTAAADANFTTSTTTLAGVANIEKYTFSGLDGTDTVTLNDTVMNNSAVTIELTSAVTGNNTVTAAGVLNTSNTVNFNDKSTAGSNTYALGNGIDIVDMGAVADTITSTNAFLTATDVIAGGAGADDFQITVTGGTTAGTAVNITAAQLSGVSGVETLTIISGGATQYTGVVLDDAIVNANASSNALAITGTTGINTLDASGVTSTAVLTMTGGAVVDTIKGGAGNDEISGGTASDKLYGTSGKDDFHVSGDTNADTIYDFTFGGTSSTTTDDQIEIDASFLGGTNGAESAASFQTGTNFAQLVNTSTGATGVIATTDVAIFDDVTYTLASLETAIEALDSAVVTQDFFAIYQDGFGSTRIAIAESDGAADSGNDFTVSDAFILNGVALSGVVSNIDTSDFIVQ